MVLIFKTLKKKLTCFAYSPTSELKYRIDLFEIYISKNISIRLWSIVHKLVMYLPEICEYFWGKYSLTVGQLPEEPLEAIIRKWRSVKQERARMINRF